LPYHYQHQEVDCQENKYQLSNSNINKNAINFQ